MVCRGEGRPYQLVDSVSDVYHGLESHPDINLVRTQTINEEGEKTVLI